MSLISYPNSGINTGDETTVSIQTKRPLKTIASKSIEGSGDVALVKGDVGLDQVDNTSDLNKPVSTATQAYVNSAIAQRPFYVSVNGNPTGTYGKAFTTIVGTPAETDTTGAYNSATGIITIPTAGLYLLTGTLRITDGTPAGTQYGFGIHTSSVDGGHFLWHAVQSTINTSRRTTYPYSRMVVLNANDQIRGFTYVDDTTARVMSVMLMQVMRISD